MTGQKDQAQIKHHASSTEGETAIEERHADTHTGADQVSGTEAAPEMRTKKTDTAAPAQQRTPDTTADTTAEETHTHNTAPSTKEEVDSTTDARQTPNRTGTTHTMTRNQTRLE